MAKGGGIMSTVDKTRALGEEQLLSLARVRADAILNGGVTTLEAKSGYGLSMRDEIKLLRIIKELNNSHLLDVHATFLGAHVVPAEFNNRADYIELVVNEMLPAIAEEGLAVDCDVFCDEGAFTPAEAKTILSHAHGLGLGLRAHVQQFSLSGGVSLVEEVPLKSVSHADFLTTRDIALLAKNDVIVEALPVAALFLRSRCITPVAQLTEAHVALAIATDFNPGSAMCHDLVLAARLGVVYFGFSVDKALRAITINAARALGRDSIGKIVAGAYADIVITNCQTKDEILYDWTKHPVRKVIKRGQAVKM
jgi:imidazolonepropionase